MEDLGDSVKPVYRFEWADGSSRRTDNLVNGPDASARVVETLAMLGREDPECTVEHVGFET